MHFWRIFLTFIGLTYGVIIGLFIVGLTQWFDSFFIVLLGGAFLGAACGWIVSPIFPKAVERLTARFLPSEPPLPPPRDVLRLGSALGIAEGVIVGATCGGIMASVLGGFVGMMLGSITAALSWKVRRHIPLLLLALLLGFLIEVGGCLIIVCFIKELAKHPVLMFIFNVEMTVVLLMRLLRQFRGLRFTREDENLGPYGS